MTMECVSLRQLREAILAGKIVEFSLQGCRYLIQQENNKGWDYLSIWRIDDPPICLGRALFDIFDGISEEPVDELLQQPCIDGRSLETLLPEAEAFRLI